MILKKIADHKKLEIEKEKRNTPLENLYKEYEPVRNFKKALCRKGMSIIGEIKRASPSKGVIREDFEVKTIAKVYEDFSIDAVSIVTEKYFFKGADEYIGEVKDITTKPILRKDFIIDIYQLFQARFLRADAVLLIASLLKDNLKDFYEKSKELGLYSVVEVHDEEELNLALEADCEIIGINNRNLEDFTVSLKTTEKLIKHIPDNKIVVSESGIKNIEDMLYLKSLGIDAVLIGETFMRNIDNPSVINQFICTRNK